MVRTRSAPPKTPKEQIITSEDEEEDEDVNEGAMEPSSDGPPVDAGEEESVTVRLNFTDFPEPSNAWEQVTSSPPTRENANMGNDQSREATNAALHKTSTTLLQQQPRRSSTGRLSSVKRASATYSNPAYQNPVKGQRQLAPLSAKQRNNVYDEFEVPDVTPEKRRVVQQQSEFTPRRSQRQKIEAVDEPVQDLGAEAEDNDDEEDTINVAQPAVASDDVEPTTHGGAEEQPQQVVAELATSQRSKNSKSSTKKRKRGRPSKEAAQQRARNDAIEDEDGAGDGLFVPGEPEDNDEDEDEDFDELQPRRDNIRPSEMFVHAQALAAELSPERPERAMVPKTPAAGKVAKRAGSQRASQAPSKATFKAAPKATSKTTSKESSKAATRPTPGVAPKATSKKRSEPPTSSSEANISKKRVKVMDAHRVADADVEADDAESQETQLWLHGQYNKLSKVFQNVDYVGCNIVDGEIQTRKRFKQRDGDVNATLDLCKQARERFNNLDEESGELDAESDPASVLTDIAQRVDGLRGRNADYETDFGSREKCVEIYAHLIPELVELLSDSIVCYLGLDRDEVAEGQIKIGHLQIVLQITTMILDLEKAAATQYTKRPYSQYAVVRPVHNGLAVPLNQVYNVLSRVYQKYYDDLRHQERRHYEARYDAERLEREAQVKKQQGKLREIQKKWETLHDERLWAETGIVRPEKRIHLQMPSHDVVEYDKNGESFTRAEGFLPRVGPNPSMIEAASSEYWANEELEALIDGLKAYAGPRVFESTFRRYCGRGKALNRFNVTEIVTTAAKIKDLETANQMSIYGDVEDWVTAIPVWTKAQAVLPGQENEDSLVDLTVDA